MKKTLAILVLLYAGSASAQTTIGKVATESLAPIPTSAPIAAKAAAAESIRADIAGNGAAPGAPAGTAKAQPAIPTVMLPELPAFDALERQQEQQAAMKQEIERLTLEKQLRDLKLQLAEKSGVRMPTLVGIVSQQAARVAEFADGRGVRSLRAGDPVIPGWKVRAVHSDMVELLNTTGKKVRTYVLMMGSAAPVLKTAL